MEKIKGLSILVVLFFVAVFIGKLLFKDAPNLLMFTYGLLLTLILLITFTVTYARYRDPAIEARKIPDNKKKKYFVSCLVAVKNEEAVIRKCVESFTNQTYENKEIIFVDDASTDKTGEILDEYAKKGLIQVIHLKQNIGKKKALAEGMLKAKGELFAFSDSDSVLAPDAIEKMVDVFNLDSNIGAASGHGRALNADTNLLTRIQDSWYEGQFSVRKAFESVYGAVTCVSGPLAVFRREAIYNFIPAWINDRFLGQEFKFATDRTLTGFVLGSKSIAKKLKKKYAGSAFLKTDYEPRNWKVVYSKSARVWTVVPDTFGRMIKQQVRWKKSFIRNIFFTGKFYWKKPFLPALAYYSHILFVFAGPFIVFRHLVYLPTQGNALSLVLYLLGIAFVGFAFGIAYKLENKHSHKWIYRPLMSLLSTLVLSWLIFYSILTIRKMTWARDTDVKTVKVKNITHAKSRNFVPEFMRKKRTGV